MQLYWMKTIIIRKKYRQDETNRKVRIPKQPLESTSFTCSTLVFAQQGITAKMSRARTEDDRAVAVPVENERIARRVGAASSDVLEVFGSER